MPTSTHLIEYAIEIAILGFAIAYVWRFQPLRMIGLILAADAAATLITQLFLFGDNYESPPLLWSFLALVWAWACFQVSIVKRDLSVGFFGFAFLAIAATSFVGFLVYAFVPDWSGRDFVSLYIPNSILSLMVGGLVFEGYRRRLESKS